MSDGNDDEARLAAVLALLASVRAKPEESPPPGDGPLGRWRAKRLAALARDPSGPGERRRPRA